jgi:K+-sensing histidine kinase KdpD
MTSNIKHLADDLESDMLRSLIIAFTVVAAVFAVFVDHFLTNLNVQLWVYFIVMAPVLLVLATLMHIMPKIIAFFTVILLYSSLLIFSKYTFIINDEISLIHLVTVFSHMLAVSLIFWKTSKTMSMGEDVELEINRPKSSHRKISTFLKLRRRKIRRINSRLGLKTKLTSGKHRG